MRRAQFESEHIDYRESARRFAVEEILPHHPRWERDGLVDRQLFTTAAAKGMLAMQVPERYGGAGIDDFRFNQILGEELGASGCAGSGLGLTLHNDICIPYLLGLTSDEQRERWLPGIADGSLITAIGMTEPEIGSDLAGLRSTARREGDEYVINGSKTFITNGINSDLIITAVKTDPTQRHAGISLLVLERGMPGLERGRNLEKVGQHSQDTAELFFQDVRVPVENRLGEEGQGFRYLTSNLAQERLSIAISAVGAARGALEATVEYVKQRTAFGQPVGSFQNSRFRLAEMATELDLATVYCDQAVLALNAGELTPDDAAKAKWWCTDLQGRLIDGCVQLHGGYGYMLEYPIARAFVDARATRIYGGTNEIMKEIIGRSLGV